MAKKKKIIVRQLKRKTKKGFTTFRKHTRKLLKKPSLYYWLKKEHPYEDKIKDLIAMDKRIFNLQRKIERLEKNIDRPNEEIAEMGWEKIMKLPEKEKEKRREMVLQLWKE